MACVCVYAYIYNRNVTSDAYFWRVISAWFAFKEACSFFGEVFTAEEWQHGGVEDQA